MAADRPGQVGLVVITSLLGDSWHEQKFAVSVIALGLGIRPGMQRRASSGTILTTSVTGLNLLDATSGPKVIKTWDNRLDEGEYVESGVDDEVSTLTK